MSAVAPRFSEQTRVDLEGASMLVARAHLRYRVRATGVRVDERQAHSWWLNGGQVQAMTHFEDTAQVIAAVRGAGEGEHFCRDRQ